MAKAGDVWAVEPHLLLLLADLDADDVSLILLLTNVPCIIQGMFPGRLLRSPGHREGHGLGDTGSRAWRRIA